MPKPYDQANYTLQESVGYLLSRARAQLSASLDRALAQYDLTHAQFGIVQKLVDASGAMSAGDLAREWCYDTGAMTRMLDRLEEKGFIHRCRGETDRRVVMIELTDKGHALADQTRQAAIDSLNRHLEGFSLEEVEQFKDYLRRVIANA